MLRVDTANDINVCSNKLVEKNAGYKSGAPLVSSHRFSFNYTSPSTRLLSHLNGT